MNNEVRHWHGILMNQVQRSVYIYLQEECRMCYQHARIVQKINEKTISAKFQVELVDIAKSRGRAS